MGVTPPAQASPKNLPGADRLALRTDREAKVIEAVRSLGNPTASQITGHARLSKTVTYQLIEGLEAPGVATKTESPAKLELVENSGARPVEHARAPRAATTSPKRQRGRRAGVISKAGELVQAMAA
jgi:hypothetical protein